MTWQNLLSVQKNESLVYYIIFLQLIKYFLIYIKNNLLFQNRKFKSCIVKFNSKWYTKNVNLTLEM